MRSELIADIFNLRKNTDGAYRVFCEFVLSHVVGRDVWKRCAHTHTISQIATVSDEAFALLLLENSWEAWKAVAGKQTSVPCPIYSVRGPGTKRFQGWTEKGIERFNELYDDVSEDRRHNEGTFDEAYKCAMFDAMAGRKRKRKQQCISEEIQVIRARIESPREDLSTARM